MTSIAEIKPFFFPGILRQAPPHAEGSLRPGLRSSHWSRRRDILLSLVPDAGVCVAEQNATMRFNRGWPPSPG